MDNDNSIKINGDAGIPQLIQMDDLLTGIIDNLEKGRSEIFDIADECQKQSVRLKVKLEELQRETGKVIQEVDKYERLERHARIRLMEVSQNFHDFSEQDIQEAYNNAHKIQVRLNDLRQKEKYLRKQRDELERELKQFQVIGDKADNLLNSTGMALKILEGNVEKINDTLEEAYRKQQMEMWIIASQESERRKIARELHDGPAQSLASMLIRLDLIPHLWKDDEDRAVNEIDTIKSIGQESLADIRRIMFDLKPTLIHEKGFASTLKEYFSDYEAKYNFNIDFVAFGPEKIYDLSLEMAVFRIIQEAITNARKHSGVNHALVKIEDKGDSLTVVVKDEGQGFDIESVCEKKESYGMIGMKERVELFGGEIDIIASPGKGTQVIIKVPVKEEAKNNG